MGAATEVASTTLPDWSNHPWATTLASMTCKIFGLSACSSTEAEKQDAAPLKNGLNAAHAYEVPVEDFLK